MAEAKDNDRFLDRWSRRKLGKATAADKETDAVSQALSAESAPEEADERHLELQKNRQAAESIDLESLDASSDFSPFFKDGVPKALKAAAMRVLWRSNPVFANLDGLNDYDENFADPELIRKYAGSAWRVGKGYLFDDDPDGVAETAAAGDGAAEADENPPTDHLEEAEAADTDDAKVEPENTRPKSAHSGGDVETATSDRPDETQEKVPLRQRLALDDWQGG